MDYRIALVVSCLDVAACGGAGAKTTGGAPIAPPDAGSETPACTAPLGSAAPTDVDSLIAYVNALGAERGFPVTVTCALESLPRPLGLLASKSLFSLQPAYDAQNPRFFLFSGNLVITVVPTGPGRNLLELGAEVSDVRSIKAELVFPIQGPLPMAQPYEHIATNGFTSCAACHGGEKINAVVTTATAFESDVLRPVPSSIVDLAFARDQAATCDATNEPDRCAVFDAIFAHGTLEPRAFSDNAKTIYDN